MRVEHLIYSLAANLTCLYYFIAIKGIEYSDYISLCVLGVSIAVAVASLATAQSNYYTTIYAK